MSRFIFITGTDTGVGKTVLTALLCRHLVETGVRVAALKPICSGGREDAEALHAAMGGTLPLDEINPWHFREPIAPVLAARRDGKHVRLREAVTFCRKFSREFDTVLIEGAGGLLSPLGEGFDSRDLITVLRASPVVVCPNKLGAVNQVRLVLEALPPIAARRAQVVLVSPRAPDAATVSNVALLGEFMSPEQIHVLPWLHHFQTNKLALLPVRVKRFARRLAESIAAK